MITFSCKRNESIVIGDGIVVTVLDVQGSQVQLGIEYPDGTCVCRSEELQTVGHAAEAWGEFE